MFHQASLASVWRTDEGGQIRCKEIKWEAVMVEGKEMMVA